MRLLWVSNDPRNSIVGQARVTREILKRLHTKGIECFATALGPAVDVKVPYPVLPWQGEKHAYQKKAIEVVKPDVIVLSHDCWNFYWAEQCKKDFPNTKLVGYYTFDGDPIHSSWIKTMQPLDLLVTSTYFGKEITYRRYPEKHIAVIPYGIDHELFNLPAPKKEIKKQTDQKGTDSVGLSAIKTEDKCIFSFVGHNQIRKNIPCILDAFELADIKHSHLFIVAHSYTTQIGGWSGMAESDLYDIVGRFENKHRITVAMDVTDDASLAALYQLSDYYVSPSQGEAPGLPILEAMACGCVPIVTNYAGAAEIVEAVPSLKLPHVMLRGNFNCNRAIVSPDILALAMRTAHKAWEEGKTVAQSNKCAEVAKNYNWDFTAQAWLEHLEGLMQGNILIDQDVERC